MAFQRTHFTATVLASCMCLGFVVSSIDPEHRLTEIVKEYQSYRQHQDIQLVVTDSAKYKWTVALCVKPTNTDKGYHYLKGDTFISKADPNQSPHGDKLYRLFIKDYVEYTRTPPFQPQPIGQVIVKETWNVREVPFDSSNRERQQIQSLNDGKWYTPTSVSALFVMYKEKEIPTNDKGWVYGIVDIENDRSKPVVLSSGKISTCMKCHTDTKYDRIFGTK